jgi:alkylglycerol monooxygenase
MGTFAMPVAGALGAGHIVARHVGLPRLAGLLKPLPIAMFAVMVWQGPSLEGHYSTLVVAGLACSMVGDVCLLEPDRFVAGLASFLVAHLFYIAAFASGPHAGGPDATALALFLAVAAILTAALWRRAGALRWPVGVYVAVISAMGWQAARRAAAPFTPEPSGILALAGALLFMTSDGLLAFGRFVRPLPAGDAAVMVTYYAAQALIALSTAG